MGSGYNDSLALGRSARSKASARTPVFFWLNVPLYEYPLECAAGHVYRTRTPILMDDDEIEEEPLPEETMVYCERCDDYVAIPKDTIAVNLSLNHDIYLDKRTKRIRGNAIEQDNGVLRERIARELQARGFLDSDEDMAKAAVEFGVPVSEIRKINAGLSASETGTSTQSEMCRAGKHEMTLDNIDVVGKFRTCKACRRESQQARRARSK